MFGIAYFVLVFAPSQKVQSLTRVWSVILLFQIELYLLLNTLFNNNYHLTRPPIQEKGPSLKPIKVVPILLYFPLYYFLKQTRLADKSTLY